MTAFSDKQLKRGAHQKVHSKHLRFALLSKKGQKVKPQPSPMASSEAELSVIESCIEPSYSAQVSDSDKQSMSIENKHFRSSHSDLGELLFQHTEEAFVPMEQTTQTIIALNRIFNEKDKRQEGVED